MGTAYCNFLTLLVWIEEAIRASIAGVRELWNMTEALKSAMRLTAGWSLWCWSLHPQLVSLWPGVLLWALHKWRPPKILISLETRQPHCPNFETNFPSAWLFTYPPQASIYADADVIGKNPQCTTCVIKLSSWQKCKLAVVCWICKLARRVPERESGQAFLTQCHGWDSALAWFWYVS